MKGILYLSQLGVSESQILGLRSVTGRRYMVMEKMLKNYSQKKAFWVSVAYEHVISGKLFFVYKRSILKS